MLNGDHAHGGAGIWLELNGRLYQMTICDAVPVTSDGRRCLLLIDHEEQTIKAHRSVSPARRVEMVVEASGHDPYRVIWRLVPLDEATWKHVPMVASVD